MYFITVSCRLLNHVPAIRAGHFELAHNDHVIGLSLVPSISCLLILETII
jgi:hypothetical protein